MCAHFFLGKVWFNMIVHSVSGTYVLKQSYYDLSVAQYHEITEIVKIGPSFLWTKKKHCYIIIYYSLLMNLAIPDDEDLDSPKAIF